MKKVLVLSPHFPPVNAADMQRVRVLLPFLDENGWQAEVLAVSPDQIASPLDEWLADGLPDNVPVHRVDAMSLAWSRLPGLGTLGFRALRALANAGDRLLAHGGFDLVYFSTTLFEVHLLGPRWKKKFGVPFLMDYQDPWVTDYYRQHPDIEPPGGKLKYAISDALHRCMEPRVLSECAGITSVSPAYPRQIFARYPTLSRFPVLVQPFPGAKRDFERINDSRVSQGFFDPKDGLIHWVYAGVVIPGMIPTIRALFKAIRDAMPRESAGRLRLHFIGTSYAKPGLANPRVLPIAREFGLENQVHEQCERVAYATVLACLRDAGALLAIGSDDPSYTASKIFPYLLARRPLLALFNEHSSVVEILGKVRGAVCLNFGARVDEVVLAGAIARLWIADENYAMTVPLDLPAFEPYVDRGCASAMCSFFRQCLATVAG